MAHYLFYSDRERLNAEDKRFAPEISASDFTAAAVVVVADTHITMSRRRQLTYTEHYDSFRSFKLIRSQ